MEDEGNRKGKKRTDAERAKKKAHGGKGDATTEEVNNDRGSRGGGRNSGKEGGLREAFGDTTGEEPRPNEKRRQ